MEVELKEKWVKRWREGWRRSEGEKSRLIKVGERR